MIGLSYNAHVKAGFQSDLSFNGGTITANMNYNLGVDTHYNKTTDTLLITSSKLLTGGDSQPWGRRATTNWTSSLTMTSLRK